MNQVKRTVGVLALSATLGVAAAQLSAAGPPVMSTALGNAKVEWAVPVTPVAFEDCVAEVARVWVDEFDVHTGQSWVSEGSSSPWGWEQGCWLFPPGVTGMNAISSLTGVSLDLWNDDALISQFVWEQSDGAGLGRGLIVKGGARQFAMLGASAARPNEVAELEPYLDHVLDLALDTAFTEGADEVPLDCTGGYAVGTGSALAPELPFQCALSVQGFEDAPESFSVEVSVTLENGLVFTYP